MIQNADINSMQRGVDEYTIVPLPKTKAASGDGRCFETFPNEDPRQIESALRLPVALITLPPGNQQYAGEDKLHFGRVRSFSRCGLWVEELKDSQPAASKRRSADISDCGGFPTLFERVMAGSREAYKQIDPFVDLKSRRRAELVCGDETNRIMRQSTPLFFLTESKDSLIW